MTKVLTLGRGPYGVRAELHDRWTPGLARVLLRSNVTDLELNVAKGWHGHDLSFLKQLPHLRSFEILDLGIKDISGIHALPQLRAHHITTYCCTPIHFEKFPKLRRCSLEWRHGAESVFQRRNLEHLFINRYSGSTSEPFAALTRLRTLGILGTPMNNLIGFRTLKHVWKLRMALWRRLESLNGIESLTNLRELTISTCRRIRSLAPLHSLTNIWKLSVLNCGDIETLSPLQPLHNLRKFYFYNDTKVIDGNISTLLSLPQLNDVAFRNRKFYTHTTEQICATLRKRRQSNFTE